MTKKSKQIQFRAHSLHILDGKPKPRSCGDCVACCTTLRVILPTTLLVLPKDSERPTEVKESGSVCRYCGGPNNNCEIKHSEYRPKECSAFQCSWLQSAPGFTGAMRPDKVGFYGVADRIPSHGPGMYFVELVPEAFKTQVARGVMREFEARVPVMRVFADGVSEIGLPGRLKPIVLTKEKQKPMPTMVFSPLGIHHEDGSTVPYHPEHDPEGRPWEDPNGPTADREAFADPLQKTFVEEEDREDDSAGIL